MKRNSAYWFCLDTVDSLFKSYVKINFTCFIATWLTKVSAGVSGQGARQGVIPDTPRGPLRIGISYALLEILESGILHWQEISVYS